ncbi:MAG: Na+/H+ antiporter subunit E [Coriobacteriia bacterium]
MRYAQSATLLMLFWLVLTGSLKALDLVFGIAVSLLLAWWTVGTLWAESDAPSLTWRQALRFVAYLVFLIKEIVLAAVGVAEKVLDPRMPIAPVMITHRTRFTREVSRIALANSITLTPGTLTVDVDGDTFVVHCLNEEFAGSISNGEFEGRIKRVFEE